MKLLRSTKSKIIENDNIENVPHLKINETILLYCNIFGNDRQHNGKLLKKLVPNKYFDKLLDI